MCKRVKNVDNFFVEDRVIVIHDSKLVTGRLDGGRRANFDVDVINAGVFENGEASIGTGAGVFARNSPGYYTVQRTTTGGPEGTKT